MYLGLLSRSLSIKRVIFSKKFFIIGKFRAVCTCLFMSHYKYSGDWFFSRSEIEIFCLSWSIKLNSSENVEERVFLRKHLQCTKQHHNLSHTASRSAVFASGLVLLLIKLILKYLFQILYFQLFEHTFAI